MSTSSTTSPLHLAGAALPSSNITAEFSSKKRKRGRTATACKACNSRKQKCDGLLPCNHCSRRGLAALCEFPADAKQPDLAPASDSSRAGASSSAAPSKSLVWKTESASNWVGGSASASAPSAKGKERALPEDGTPVVPQLSTEAGDSPAFYGSNHFGPRAALRMIAGGTDPDAAPSSRRAAQPSAGSYKTYRAELDPFSQVSQVRDFIALLPRRKICDALIERFFTDYNEFSDVVFRPDFQAKYDRFWRRSLDQDDVAQIDMRWLALLFIMLSFGVLLEWRPNEGSQGLEARQEASKSWYWASRRAIVSAPTFYGESLDIVRAGCLVTWLLVITRRAPEAWLTVGFSVRFSQAQGLHVDGERWGLSVKETEIRRRLWAQIYVLDRSISLFLGRPLSIQNEQSAVAEPSNLTDEELDNPPEQAHPLDFITRTTSLVLNKSLTTVIGLMQNLCFGLQPTTHRHVLMSDQELVKWASDLPPHFRIGIPNTDLDRAKPYLIPQRLSLHSRFHLARISLHRPFLMRAIVSSSGPSFQVSRTVAIDSALDDLALRLQLSDCDPLYRFQYMTVAGGFSSCTVLGTVLIRDPSGPLAGKITRTLESYLKQQQATPLMDSSHQAEIRVLEMCLARAEALRKDIVSRTSDNGGGTPNTLEDAGASSAPRISHERSSLTRGGSPQSIGHYVSHPPAAQPSQILPLSHAADTAARSSGSALAEYDLPADLSTVPPWEPAAYDNYPQYAPAPTGNSPPFVGGTIPDGSAELPTWPESWMDFEDLIDKLTSGPFASEPPSLVEHGGGGSFM